MVARVNGVDTNHKVAAELAMEVRSASGGPRTWRRVASLLQAFGVERLSPEVRERITAALADAQIEVHPPLQSVGPDSIVRLSLPDTDAFWLDVAESTAGAARRPAISGTEWQPGGVMGELDLQAPRTGGLTAWFDIDPARATPQQVLDELWPFCAGLTREMVEDLMGGGARRGVRSYGPDGRMRRVALFGVAVVEPEAVDSARPTRAGALVFQTVTLLAGEDWLLGCWYWPEVCRGGSRQPADPDGRAFGRAVATAQQRLKRAAEAPAPDDIGIAIAYSLACRYPSAARRLSAWMEEWELEFHRHLDVTAGRRLSGLECNTLIDLRALLAELRGRMHAFEQPGLEPTEAWFAGVGDADTATRTGELVATCLADLRELDDTLRTTLELLATGSAAEQAAASHQLAVQGERLNRQVALITSVLLVPTFLAEVFGTKPYPGGEGSVWQFVLMLVTMIVLGLVTYRLLTRRRA